MAEIDFDKVQLEAYLEALGEAQDRIAEVRYTAMNEALMAEFGQVDGLSGEELHGVAEDDPLVAALDRADNAIAAKVDAVRFKLLGDVGDPPF